MRRLRTRDGECGGLSEAPALCLLSVVSRLLIPVASEYKMPRKRRKGNIEGAGLQTLEGEEEAEEEEDCEEREQRSLRGVKKCSSVDACIVISDSEGEEMLEKNGLQNRRTKLHLDRVKLAAKRRVAQMTEEEQLALAVKMSEQEASDMNSQQEKEEELLRKAIAASLNVNFQKSLKAYFISKAFHHM
uniref:BRCA1-A complex subunit RAP80 n=1 Tax=Geotrypetes seraphini TaxID=260995 RepID=A0A6P8Q8L4_GEOSA|nr:BRCA1-A complex subunit RAP80-like isoform X2 [Geotrypetes seraphini]